jgi:hypothetical protein
MTYDEYISSLNWLCDNWSKVDTVHQFVNNKYETFRYRCYKASIESELETHATIWTLELPVQIQGKGSSRWYPPKAYGGLEIKFKCETTAVIAKLKFDA